MNSEAGRKGVAHLEGEVGSLPQALHMIQEDLGLVAHTFSGEGDSEKSWNQSPPSFLRKTSGPTRRNQRVCLRI